MIFQEAIVPKGYECRSCGDDRYPETRCSRCGGYGLVHDVLGDPTDCSDCGGSGVQYPPVCPGCSKYRKIIPR